MNPHNHTELLTEKQPQSPNPPSLNSRATPPTLRRKGWWLLVGVVGLAGLAWASGVFKPDSREPLPTDTTSPTITGIPVTTSTVTRRPVQRKIDAIGTLHGFEEVIVTAKVEGRVQAVKRDLGDRVRSGEVLVEIEPAEYELAAAQDERALQVELAKLGLQSLPDSHFDPNKVPSVIQARVRMETAKAKMTRTLGTTTALSADDRDNAAGEYRAAEAEHANQILLAQSGLATARLKQAMLASAKLKLSETKITVPMPSRPIPGLEDGATYAIASRNATEGSMLRVGTEVFKLVIDRTLKLRLPVPERYSAEVRTGQAVEVYTAVSAKPVLGTVARISPWVDPATRAYDVEVHVPNPNGVLKTGGFAKASILVRVDAAATTVPLTALHSFAGTTRVYVVDGDKVHDVPVTLGVQTAEWIEIASPPLAAHANVVTSGHGLLAEGTTVTIRPDTGDKR